MNSGNIEALIPRGLITNPIDIINSKVTLEGLCPCRIFWEKGKITFVEGLVSTPNNLSNVLLPRLIEPHSHIDKAFTGREFPNKKGGYDGALTANLSEIHNRTALKVKERAEGCISLAIRHGVRAIRSHVDSFHPNSNSIWNTLIDIKNDWGSYIDLQLVALVPLEYWETKEGNHLARRVAQCKGLLGGVLAPPFKSDKAKNSLLNMLKLANKLGCGIDLHIDESASNPGSGIKLLLKVLDNFELEVPITCSHSSSMSLLKDKFLQEIAERIASHQINIIALPLTNSWLLGKDPNKTPIKRPFAPIKQLQQAGVFVAIGGDNVQDAWLPIGNIDPLSLMSISLPITQLSPWERIGLSPFTTSAAKVLNLSWKGDIKIGNPADFILLKANSWIDILSKPLRRRILINGEWLDNLTINQLVTEEVNS